MTARGDAFDLENGRERGRAWDLHVPVAMRLGATVSRSSELRLLPTQFCLASAHGPARQDGRARSIH
jgi:hypothetical protein